MSSPNKQIRPDFDHVLFLIQEARSRAFSKVNEELVSLYFSIGKIVSDRVSEGSWGDGTVNELADYIKARIQGVAGFNRRGLYRMKQFYEAYSEDQFVTPLVTQLKLEVGSSEKFVSSLVTQLNWTHHLLILSKTKTPEERLFYMHLAIRERLTKRELERQLNTATFERSLLANQKSNLPTLPLNFLKDPYIFEFLDLPDVHSERDLENALILNLQKFILEIGKGFTYMGNQFRLQVGMKDYFTDLLFYHRDLQCLVLFELKIQDFEPEFLGKLNFYLEALDRDVKRPHERPTVGILLCKGKDTEVVEYALARNTSPTIIAEYETKLIPRQVLAAKLHHLVDQLSKENNTD